MWSGDAKFILLRNVLPAALGIILLAVSMKFHPRFWLVSSETPISACRCL